MCEPTNGGACECAPTTTTKPPKRRTCETDGCSRVSGDARFCRGCRAVAPVRADMERAQATHEAVTTQLRSQIRTLTLARDSAQADAVRVGALLNAQTTRANRAERDIADAQRLTKYLTEKREEARAEAERLRAEVLAVAQHRDRLECERHDAITERDEVTQALAVQHDHARGQEVRLRRAKAEIATLTTRLRIAWGVIGLLCVALGVVGVFG